MTFTTLFCFHVKAGYISLNECTRLRNRLQRSAHSEADIPLTGKRIPSGAFCLNKVFTIT